MSRCPALREASKREHGRERKRYSRGGWFLATVAAILSFSPGVPAATESWPDFPASSCAGGLEFANRGELDEAVKVWSDLSPYAYASSRSYAVTRCLQGGLGIGTRSEHYQWLENAAGQGSSDAELYLAIEHFEVAFAADKAGQDDTADARVGMQWLQLAVAHHNADARTLLAFHVMNGTYIAADPERGRALLREAAEEGSLAACEELAEAYGKGELGFPASAELAGKWRGTAIELASKLRSRSLLLDDDD